MKSLGMNLMSGIGGALIAIPFTAAVGVSVGFSYAKFSNLSKQQTSLAFAIWYAVEAVLINIVNSFTKNKKSQKTISAIIISVTTLVGSYELLQRNLIGPKMVMYLILTRAIYVRGCLKSEFL